MDEPVELLREETEGRVRLLSPGVGLFTGAAHPGHVLTEREHAGWLVTLERAVSLRVPEGVSGVVSSPSPERIRAPVGWGDVLYELEPLERAGTVASKHTTKARDPGGALVLRSPQTGRFYHRPSPAEPALVSEGALLRAGAPVGLIEVMKTFTHVTYRAEGGLPASARVVRVLAADGADVEEGEPLIEVAPA
jgi:acetyl-CoA carboxylase biotin carboxyl carrier protein